MNYQSIYNSIMERARSERGLTRKEATEVTGYVERHRILPGCMGGRYTKGNIAYLTPEEHYVAHQLLVKIYPKNSKLIFAASAMCSASESHQGNRKNKLYGWLRRKLSAEAKKRIGKKNGAFGSRWIHNGLLNKKILKGESIPNGWELGRKFKEIILVAPFKRKEAALKTEMIYKRALEESDSISQAIKKLGMQTRGGNYGRMKIVAKKYGLMDRFSSPLIKQ